MRIIVHIWPVSCNETVLENYTFLVYVNYTHPGHQTSIFGKKNRAYYIRIFTVHVMHAHTHTHTYDRFMALFLGLPGWTGARRKLLLDFMVQGVILEADNTNNPDGHHSIRTNQRPIPSCTIFTPDALPVATLPIYPGLRQAPNMRDCIPSGLVK